MGLSEVSFCGQARGFSYSRQTCIRDAADVGALEIVVVKLLDGGSKIGRCLVFNEAANLSVLFTWAVVEDQLPFASAVGAALTVNFAVDNVEAGLTCEVLQVLWSSCKS